MPLTFESVDELYARCNGHSVERHTVRHDGARRFALALNVLEARLGELKDDPYWTEQLKPFKRYRYAIASRPAKLDSAMCLPSAMAHAAREGERKCKYVYPHLADDFSQVVQAALSLAASGDAPLVDALLALARSDTQSSRLVVLVRDHATSELSAALKTASDVVMMVCTPSAFLSNGPVDNVYAVGPLSWFPEHIRTAPRFKKLTSVSFDWLKDSTRVSPVFASSDSKRTFGLPGSGSDLGTNLKEPSFGITAEEVAPVMNWEGINADIGRQASNGDKTREVPARLLLLNGNVAVYVEDSKDAYAHVIAFETSQRVVKVSAVNLEAAMCILIRTCGGGDLVATVADQILGDRALQVRSIQKRWKSALCSVVLRGGEDAVLQKLRTRGCKRANRGNLRNWMGERNIRPDSDKDFLSILTVCGLESEQSIFVTNARLLDRVHRSAGFRIRRTLLKEVNKADLTKLQRDGHMDFELPGAAGGSFTAYRIEDLAPQSFNVEVSRLGQPFYLGTRYG